jgi:hypothetical protein
MSERDSDPRQPWTRPTSPATPPDREFFERLSDERYRREEERHEQLMRELKWLPARAWLTWLLLSVVVWGLLLFAEFKLRGG